MKLEVFGELRRDNEEQRWQAHCKLPTLAQYDVYYGDYSLASMEEEEKTQAQEPPGFVDKAFDKISGKVAGWIEKDLSEYEDFKGSPEDDEDYRRSEERQRDWFKRGIFPLTVEDPEGKGPTPEQERAFREFIADEPGNVAILMNAIYESYRKASKDDPYWFEALPPITSPEALKKVLRCTDVIVSQYHLAGYAYLSFSFHCLWDEEHGLGVLFHKDRVVEVGDYDTLYNITEADNLPGQMPLTPHQELVNAIFAKDEEQIKKLIAAGVNINAVGKDEIPPLHYAAMQLDVDMVKRLLELGADPKLKDADGKTALQVTQEYLKTMDLGQKSLLMRLALRIAQFFNPGPFNAMRRNGARIMELLKSRS